MLSYFSLRRPAAALLLAVLFLAAVSGCSSERYTELMNAAKDGNVAAVQHALERGVDVNERTSQGKRPLMLAASEGHVEVAKLLIQHGAEVDAADSYGTTALIVAATAGHHKVVALLLEQGADPTVQDSSGGSPLVNAAFFGRTESVRALLSNMPPLTKQDGEELLLLSAGLGHADIVDALITHGVDVNGRGLKSRTALMAAAAFNQVEVVRRLLKQGGDVRLTDDDGMTSLQVAEDKGNDEIAALLAQAVSHSQK